MHLYFVPLCFIWRTRTVIFSENTLIRSYMYQCIIICISKYFNRQPIEQKTRGRKTWFWRTYSKFTIIAMYTEQDKYKEEDKVPACQLWEAKVEQRSPFWEALQCKCQGQYWRKHAAPPDPLPPSLCVNLDSVPLSHSLSGTEADAFMSKEGRTATFAEFACMFPRVHHL